MDDVINFQQKIEERRLQQRQDKKLKFEDMIISLKYDECLHKAKKLDYLIDTSVMMSGWMPIKAIPFDDDFLRNIEEDRIWRNKLNLVCREERSKYKDGKLCMVIYQENKNFLNKTLDFT